MTLDEALKVATFCVNKAAGFKAISDKRKIALNRLEDKLEFIGITDNTRLNALRRYLVRNEEIGTQRISMINEISSTDRRFYRYMLTSHDLLGIKKDWTLLKLAQLIVDKSGVSLMPESTARAIMADCRALTDGREPYDLVKPPPTPPPTPTPTPLFAPIIDTLQFGTSPAERSRLFAECVVNNERYGVSGVEFNSTKGDSRRYFLEFLTGGGRQSDKAVRSSPIVSFIEAAVNANWTYDCLAEFISDYSQVELPSNSLAGEIAMTAIDRNKAQTCPSQVSNDPCKFNKKSPIGPLLDVGLDTLGRNGFQRLIVDLKSNLDPQPVVSSCVLPAALGLNNVKRLGVFAVSRRPSVPCSIETSVTPATTVGGLVNIVQNCLEG